MQVQSDPELENAYIRARQEQLTVSNVRATRGGLTSYQPGNILLVHIPFEKTRQMFKKRRRNFDTLATFIGYEGGNVICELLKPVQLRAGKGPATKNIVLPIFYTKIIATNIDEIPPEYAGLTDPA
ncbi:hypothetical protein FACS189472_18090 [Alphaproteobacteria bacterium]|nr:hypothetical protein FACS189472_18090 [Alphaproteobacteria bacterium]